MSKWRDSITGITVDVEDVVCKDCSDCDIPLPDGTENASEQIPSGTKHDRGKLPMHLLSTRAMKGTAAVLRFGANKYGDRNWEGGIKYSRIYGALLRHIIAFWEGEESDDETGLSHVDHAACCIMFLQHFIRTSMDDMLDDRPGKE
jgi:hypothetical protein